MSTYSHNRIDGRAACSNVNLLNCHVIRSRVESLSPLMARGRNQKSRRFLFLFTCKECGPDTTRSRTNPIYTSGSILPRLLPNCFLPSLPLPNETKRKLTVLLCVQRRPTMHQGVSGPPTDAEASSVEQPGVHQHPLLVIHRRVLEGGDGACDARPDQLPRARRLVLHPARHEAVLGRRGRHERPHRRLN